MASSSRNTEIPPNAVSRHRCSAQGSGGLRDPRVRVGSSRPRPPAPTQRFGAVAFPHLWVWGQYLSYAQKVAYNCGGCNYEHDDLTRGVEGSILLVLAGAVGKTRLDFERKHVNGGADAQAGHRIALSPVGNVFPRSYRQAPCRHAIKCCCRVTRCIAALWNLAW